MAGTVASFPISPPLPRIPMVDLKDGCFNQRGYSFFQQIWAAIQGSGGSAEQIAVIFGMHGDGMLSSSGVLTVSASESRAFVASAFSDTTDAANITSGFLDEARIADQSLPQAKISGLSDPVLVSALPTPAAGLRAFVSDSTVAGLGNFGVAVLGGGSSNVPVYADGANWLIG